MPNFIKTINDLQESFYNQANTIVRQARRIKELEQVVLELGKDKQELVEELYRQKVNYETQNDKNSHLKEVYKFTDYVPMTARRQYVADEYAKLCQSGVDTTLFWKHVNDSEDN